MEPAAEMVRNGGPAPTASTAAPDVDSRPDGPMMI